MKGYCKSSYIKRGEIIEYAVGSQLRYAINIQNDIGNRFSPTVIALAIELVDEEKFQVDSHIMIEHYENEGKEMVLNIDKIRTISKERIRRELGRVPEYLGIMVNATLSQSFGIDKSYKIYAVDLSKVVGNIVGSEQGGERPVLVLNERREGDMVHVKGIAMTSQMQKAKLPTHVKLYKGEGHLAKDTQVLFEQFVEYSYNEKEEATKKEKSIQYIGISPKEKLPTFRNSYNVSVGLGKPRRKNG